MCAKLLSGDRLSGRKAGDPARPAPDDLLTGPHKGSAIMPNIGPREKALRAKREAQSSSQPEVIPVHPAAAIWPMLPEPDLRRLADDIKENGLRYAIVRDAEGAVLDGRNRLAACRIAGIEPRFETFDGDAIAYVLSANNERRHLTLPQRAAAVALTLASDGKRAAGRWKRDSVPMPDTLGSQSNWAYCMAEAGLVLDHCPEWLPKVVAGTESLDAAVKKATEIQRDKAKRSSLPEDLGVLVDAGELSIDQAIRRSKLNARYAGLVASGDLTLDEAESLNNRDAREYQEAIQRSVEMIDSFLFGLAAASHMRADPMRADILSALSEHSRTTFLKTEDELWPAPTM